MAKSHRLTLTAVRAAMRLVGECRDQGHDPGQWRRHAAEGIGALLGVRVVAASEFRWRRPDGAVSPIDFLQVGLTEDEFNDYFLPFYRSGAPSDDALFAPLKAATEAHVVLSRRSGVPDAVYHRGRMYTEYHEPVGVDATAVSVWGMPDNRVDMFGLHREAGERDISGRELNLLRLFHAELGRLIGPVLVSADDPFSPSRLPPRVREALACLLEGDSEKQIALRMGLSRATVHQYVTALYRHYQVTSRAELLARVLRRSAPSGFAGAGPSAGGE
ncbi:MAG: helix-turn-helix transcriptional regulator [Gemmataceae bacterium]|nr:helix-turn-helix transcriptional regulator [Gemmataceae bacterium]